MREQSPVRPGDLVDGKYRIESILGLGGMGVVVRALHEQLGRAVAMKFLLPEMLRNAAVVQRFEREARATARLQNEHIIDVLDVGRLPTGEPFIVMELLEGKDLASYVTERTRLDVEETIELAMQICDGVAEAHANGIVHRDLKPQNVFVTTRRDGRRHVKVLDFGISKISGEVGGALTGTSDILGSPFYMSPEQLLATRDVGPSGDVWALGVILYELLAGSVPFGGETLAQICMRIIQEPHVPIAQVRNDVPPWLASVVNDCLQKDPARRTPSVDALAAALRARGAVPSRPELQAAPAHASTVFLPHGGPPSAAHQVTHPAMHSGSHPVAQPVSHGAMPVHGAPAPGGSTQVGWGHSSQPGMTQLPVRASKSPLYAAGAAVALVVLCAGGFGIHHLVSARSAASAKPVHEPPPAATTGLVSTGAAPSVAPEPPVSPAATASASASASAPPPPAPKTTATAPAAAAGATKPPTTPTSRPASTGAKPTEPDFPPSLRK